MVREKETMLSPLHSRQTVHSIVLMSSLMVVLFIILFIYSSGVNGADKCLVKGAPSADGSQSAGTLTDCDMTKSACFYFMKHSTQCSRSFFIHGCALLTALPPECSSNIEYYKPFDTLKPEIYTYGNSSTEMHEGSIKCCRYSYCNELPEPLYVPVQYSLNPPGFFLTYLALPLALILLVLIVIFPIIPDKKTYWLNFKDRVKSWEWIRKLLRMGGEKSTNVNRNDMEALGIGLSPLDSDDKMHTKHEINVAVTGFFSSWMNMKLAIQYIITYEAPRPEGKEGEDEEEEKKEDEKGKKGKQDKKDKKKTNMTTTDGGNADKPKEMTMHWSNNETIYQSSSHSIARAVRTHPTRLTELLHRMVELGPYQTDFDPNELGDLFVYTANALKEENTLLDLEGDINVIGNLDGSYCDLFRWFSILGWPPKTKYLFLGGVINPMNQHSLETITLLFALKRTLPHHIYILRGESETVPLNVGQRGYTSSISSCLGEVANRALSNLPLAALISNKILCVHSSIPPDLISTDSIRFISRPILNFHKTSIEAHILMTQVDDELKTDILRNSPKGNDDNGKTAVATTVCDTQEIVSVALQKKDPSTLYMDITKVNAKASQLGVELIVRAHSPCKEGISFLSEKVVSLWSAPGVCSANAGCALHIDTDLAVSVNKLYKYGFREYEDNDVIDIDLTKILAMLAEEKNGSDGEKEKEKEKEKKDEECATATDGEEKEGEKKGKDSQTRDKKDDKEDKQEKKDK